MRLDPRRLLTFEAVAEHRSFSLAARSLSLTQPAVSQQIRALEEQVGARLIERRGGRFELTPTGELVRAHANALADVLRLAETQLEEARDTGLRLRVGTFASALATLVPGAIARIGAGVDVVQGGTDELVDAVRDGGLHVAICFQDARDDAREHRGVRRHEILEEPLAAALGPSRSLAARKRVRLAELAGETWAAAGPDGIIHRACVAAGFEPEIAYRTTDPLAIRALVIGGLAVTLAPRLLGPDELHGVVFVRLGSDAPRRAIYAVTAPGATHPLAGDFVTALRRRARELRIGA